MQQTGSGEREKPRRIVYYVDEAASRGAERTVLQLAEGLPRSRYEVAVICRPDRDFIDWLQDLGVEVIATRRGWTMPARIRGLLAQLSHVDADIVHVFGSGDSSIRIAAALARVPALIWSRSGGEETTVGQGWRHVLAGLLDSATLRFVDRLVVGGRSTTGRLTDRGGMKSNRVAVVPGGVDLKRFDPGRISPGAWRQRLRVPREAALIAGVGPLERGSGFQDLIQARAQLADPDVWVVIAGDGPEWEDLRALALGLDLADRVLFPGAVVDTPELLADADVLVFPAPLGGDPQGLLEAMAMARPVIASDSPGLGEVITEGVDGRLAAAGDVEALSSMIRQLLSDVGGARRMGRKARSKVEREYSVEHMVRRTALLYEDCLSEEGL
ncbi:MAG: glycosyltransferase [Gemmatimonadota bacterium]|nr:MAG: glycosyltransferase [Gemmatimonadota bacterium]